MSTVTWSEAFDDFLIFKRASVNAKTLEFYRYQVRTLVEWATERPCPLTDFSARQARAFVASRQHLSINTQRHGIVAGKAFMRFCKANRYVETDAFVEIVAPSRPRKSSVRLPSKKEISKFLQAIRQRHDPAVRPEARFLSPTLRKFLTERDYTMACVLCETGLRISECCGLKVSDYDGQRRSFSVMGKGAEPRNIPFGPQLRDTIEAWLRVRPPVQGCEYLFMSQVGTRCDPHVVAKAWKRNLELADVPNITRHAMRHYALTNVARIDVLAAQEMAGHSRIETTMGYVHNDPERNRAIIESASNLGQVLECETVGDTLQRDYKPVIRAKRPRVV